VVQPQPTSTSSPPTTSTPQINRPAHAGSTATPRPGSTVPSMPTPIQRPGSTAPTISRPGSTIPRPGSTKPALNKPTIQVPVGRVGTPLKSGIGQDTPIRSPATMTPQIPSSNTWPMDPERRGIKREREDSSPAQLNGAHVVNGNGPMNTSTIKAGNASVRPRPIKKQRMVSPTHYKLNCCVTLR
jgi:hypothetical protein